MQEALEAILGENAKRLSATNIVRLKESWEKEYADWNGRDLSEKRSIYIWANGIYFNVRLTDERPCILVLLGATEEGNKELIAVYDGIRESKISWQEVLQDLKRMYKLGISAQKHWRKLRGHELIAKIIQGSKFKDGEEVKEKAA